MPSTAGATDKPTILVIDDSPDDLAQLQQLLGELYQVRLARQGEHGLEMACTEPVPSAILLGMELPGMDAYAVCERLKADPHTAAIPVIFLSARTAPQEAEKGLALGAADFIAKPISPALCLARLRTHLALQRAREVTAIQDVTILALAALTVTRDADTSNHIRRIQHYVRALAWKLSSHPRYRDYLTVANITLLFKSAALHDIGKAGVPDRILLKRGRLTPEEFEIMKTHTSLGRAAIAGAEKALGLEVAFLTMAKAIAYSHQEKWDGSGYPQGLAGDQIPIPARLLAVADVYDALISRRAYKEPMPHADAVQVIGIASGQHFDPDVVAAFQQIHQQFYAIALAYADHEGD